MSGTCQGVKLVVVVAAVLADMLSPATPHKCSPYIQSVVPISHVISVTQARVPRHVQADDVIARPRPSCTLGSVAALHLSLGLSQPGASCWVQFSTQKGMTYTLHPSFQLRRIKQHLPILVHLSLT